MSKKTIAMTVNVLLKKEDKVWLAHCLELDIVASSTRIKDVKKEMGQLIGAQVDYAFSNDNLNNLYHPAPPEVWKEFYSCIGKVKEKEEVKKQIKIPMDFAKPNKIPEFVPPIVLANECFV